MGYENTVSTVICKPNGVCHCDWRMTIYGCEESDFLRNTYIANAIWSIMLAIFEIILLVHRIFWMKQTVFDHSREFKSWMRIRPLEGLLITTSLCFTLRALNDCFLIFDVLPDNILRALIFDVAWQPGFMGTTIYFVGVINTLPRLSSRLDRSWFPSHKSLELFGSALIFGPPLTNNVLAITTGYFEDVGLVQPAKIFIYFHCALWFLYCTALAIGLAYFGWNLTVVINGNIGEVAEIGSMRHMQLKKALNKLRVIFSSLTVCFLIFAASMLSYIVERDQILQDLDKSIPTFIPWTFASNVLGTVAIGTIAAGSPLFVGKKSSHYRYASEDYSMSKDRTGTYTGTWTETTRNASSMEQGRTPSRTPTRSHFDHRRTNSSEEHERTSTETENTNARAGNDERLFNKNRKPLSKVEEEEGSVEHHFPSSEDLVQGEDYVSYFNDGETRV